MAIASDPATDLLAAARQELPEAVDIRRTIHRHPERGLQLPRTQATVLSALRDLPVDVRHTGDAVTSVVADLHGAAGPGPTILLRADMDALPMPEDTGLESASEVAGAMHACGHDADTAMLVGAVRVLAARRDSFAGTVRFMFQPGEEGFFGARHMVAEGVLDDPHVDAVFALHVAPNIPAGLVATKRGAIMAAANVVRIVVTGKGGHASSPYLANDPMPVAAEIVTALNTFVTRRISTFDPVVLTITQIHGGTTNNVIPETVELEGTLRSVSEGSRRSAIDGIHRVATNVAAAHEMEAHVEIDDGYPVVVNDAAFADFALDVVRRTLGAKRAVEMPAPVMGAEDFAYLLHERPGAFAFLGVCPPDVHPAHAHGCHSNRMVLSEDAMADGIAVYAATALDYLGGLGPR